MPEQYDDVDDYNWLMAEIIRWESVQARALGKLLVDHLSPKSVVDIGCGPGLYLLPFLEAKCRVLGLDGASGAGRMLPAPLFHRVDLRRPISLIDRFDLSLCIEVAEHLRPEYADTLVNTITTLAPICFFSAAGRGQGGSGHFNEQPKEYWLEKFRARGWGIHEKNDKIMREIHANVDFEFERTQWLRRNGMVLAWLP